MITKQQLKLIKKKTPKNNMSKLKIKSLNKKSFAQQSQYYLIIGLIIIVSFLFIKPLFSAQAQEDAQTEASEESTILNIKKVIQDKQVELGQGEQRTGQLKQAYLAQVKRVSAETITVLNRNVNVVIPLTEDLEIMHNGEKIELDQIAVDDWIIVYSIIGADGVPTIKRLVLSDKDFTQTERQIVLGTITELYSTNLLFDSRTGANNLNYLLDVDTQYFDINGDEINQNDLYPQLQCLIVAKIKNNGQWRASSIKALVDLND
jgi:hypothetical protein